MSRATTDLRFRRVPGIGLVVASLVAFALSGCGTQSGFIAGPISEHRVTPVPQHPAGNEVVLTAGPTTRVTLGPTRLVVGPSNIEKLTAPVQWQTVWVPLVRVPTLDGTELSLQGTATVAIPDSWMNAKGAHWARTALTVTVPFNTLVPERTKTGGEITMAMAVRTALIQGWSPTAGRQTLMVTRPQPDRLRWQHLTVNRRVPTRQIFVKQTVGPFVPFSRDNGGGLPGPVGPNNQALGDLQVTARTALHGLPFRTSTRYFIKVVTYHHSTNIVFYDRNSHESHWYIQQFTSLPN